ncbi:MAG: acyl CoA:acetate/3-ketoacid CoA transferase [Lachnospiraceae bacterium]|jgi:propionate CoA-transferase
MAKIITVAEAAELIKDGDVIGSAVQGMTGWPEEIGKAIEKRFLETGHPAGITHIHGAGNGDFARRDPEGKKCHGECVLAHDGLMTRTIHGHCGCSFEVVKKVAENKIQAYNFPLGMIGQIWREQGRAFPGLLTKVGLGTFMDARFDGCKINQKAKDEGEDFVKYIPDFNGTDWLFYTLPALNVALLRPTTADEAGNCTYEKECMPCEPLDLALACKAAGGIVIAQVERLAATGTLDPRQVKVPGILVDYVCVAEHPEDIMQTHITHFNPAFTGEVRVPLASGTVAKLPLDAKKVFARRAALELKAGDKANFGIGMPGLIPPVLVEEGVSEKITLISESGLIGGVPAPGGDFGAHYNPLAMYPQTDHFSFFDAGGLDVGVFGLSEVDKMGGVNTTFLNGRTAGVGGFPNISANAKHSIFVGTFTAKGLVEHIEDGKLVIDQEGKFDKFVDTCVQLSFSAIECLKKGNKVTFITERCVIEATMDGLMVTEVAPGIDLQKDVLDHMAAYILPEGGPKLMDAALFQEEWGGLEGRF